MPRYGSILPGISVWYGIKDIIHRENSDEIAETRTVFYLIFRLFITREWMSMPGISDAWGVDRFSDDGGEGDVGSIARGSAAALHSAQESEPFRGVVQGEEGKVTAIVGASGSGKMMLIKLLLRFYEPNKGTIRVENTALKDINPHVWHAHTGCVMQDGFLFSNTIARNIAVGTELIDKERLGHAVEVANIWTFIESLSLGYNTKIGMEGSGVSQEQWQRLLIARAVYKN